MMICEREKSIIFQDAIGLVPHRAEAIREVFGFGVLDLAIRTSGRGLARANGSKDVALPYVEKVSELRVVNVVEERWVGQNRVHTSVGNIRRARHLANFRDLSWRSGLFPS
eukprot:TRINITY_DN58173_c0_g1_i1.p1 TRINITY_DN58173_c0_g1~~TRINITY_DN58173_c0_g1_i1.p1  ORF type:complete len:111 (-),score=4.50 TRINITY_DN58173_c0_g1_i1:30-362(-)